MYTHDQHQRPKAHKMHAFQVYGQAISSKYQKIIIKVQAHQASNGPRRSKWPNFASLHIWFATSWLNLKFVCLFHISIFLWILKIHVPFDVLCSCIYLKKKFKIPKSFPKKETNFQKKKKSLWTRGIEPLSHLKKKKKIFELGALDFLVTFFKKNPFFSFNDFKIL